jgi:GNAT superfamily N-acetyltransferase
MISVRRARARDIDAFKQIVTASVLELCKDDYTPMQLHSLLAQYPGRALYEKWLGERVLLIAEHGKKIVGFAQYLPANHYIEAMHVLPDYTRRGVGRQLVAAVEAIATVQGAKRISLGSSLNAVGFYEKCGYTRKANSRYRCSDGVVLDVVNFEKDLGC